MENHHPRRNHQREDMENRRNHRREGMENHPIHNHRREGMENRRNHRREGMENRRKQRREGMENHPSRNHRREGRENHPNHDRLCEEDMENQYPDRNHHIPVEYHDILLSMNIHCCVDCPRVLEKKLRRMPEVDDVSIVDTDRIKVSGTFDPETLLEKVKKWGKRVKLLPMEELNKGQQKKVKEKVVEKPIIEEPHNCDEEYKPPGYSEKVCREFLCKVHPRSRPIYGNKLEDESFPFFGFNPFNNGGRSMIFSGYQPPYGNQQPPYGYQQSPYGYQPPPPYMLPFGQPQQFMPPQ